MRKRNIVVLGNFDGVHIAHRALLNEAVKQKISYGGEAEITVWTFRELPVRDDRYGLITVPPLRKRYLELYGADRVVFADFDSVRDMPPDRFVREILRGELDADIIICGFNYRFGCGAAADAGELERLAADCGARCITVPEIVKDGSAVSSSRIRVLIAEGRVSEAAELLGHPFVILSEVVHGRHVGSGWGIPTANLRVDGGEHGRSEHGRSGRDGGVHSGTAGNGCTVCPKNGVYATFTVIDGKKYPSVTNIGVCPTVTDGKNRTCETHIIGYSGDIYGKETAVGFISRIRDEIRFSSEAELCAAIENDIKKAETFFEGS